MQIDLAHLRERSTSGSPTDFAMFAARSNSGGQVDNNHLLTQLTFKARKAGLKVDQAALVCRRMVVPSSLAQRISSTTWPNVGFHAGHIRLTRERLTLSLRSQLRIPFRLLS